MLRYINKSKRDQFVLAHNDVDIFHPSMLESGLEITTGQENLELYDTFEDLQKVMLDHGVPVYLIDGIIETELPEDEDDE